MAAKTISFAIQKGGVGKSTSTAVTCFLLAEMGYKTLAVDLDSQGNLTSILTQKNIYEFEGQTVLEAMKEQNAKKFIHHVMENLDIITSNDFTAFLPKFLYEEYRGNKLKCLDETLSNVKEEYDFIIIDCPPALSEHTLNALGTSDNVVICFETGQFCYDALDRFLETYTWAKEKINPSIEIAGILCSMIDMRSSETEEYIKALDANYKGARFDSLIKRQASTRRLQLRGFIDNPEMAHAIKPFRPFVKELLERVKQ